jgi:hypothetical protein
VIRAQLYSSSKNHIADYDRLLIHTVLADAVHTHLYPVYPSGKGLPEWIGIHIEAFRRQAVHAPAFFAVKVRVGMVMFIGCHAIAEGPAAGADAFHQALFHQDIQYAINSDAVDALGSLQRLVNIGSGKWVGVIANDLQNMQAVVCAFQAGSVQHIIIVALGAHISSFADRRQRPLFQGQAFGWCCGRAEGA